MKLKLKFLKYLAHLLCGLGYISFFYKKQEDKKKFSFWRILGILVLILTTILLSSILYIFSFYGSGIKNSVNGCGVIFGAAVWKDDIPSHALNDRIITGINLYKEKKVNCLVLSGGKSKFGLHEVDVMKKIALEEGVEKKDLILDYNGNNTLMTIQNLNKNKSDYVFISNDFHLARISLIAQRKGIKKFHLQVSNYLNGRYLKEYYFLGREIGGVILMFFLL